MVGNGDGRHTEFLSFFDQLGNFNQPVQQAIMGVIMEMDKRHKVIIAKKPKYLIGIDEAGRGALAGPVAVGVATWALKDWPAIKKFLKDYPVGKDSKKLTPKQREFWFEKIRELEKRKLVKFQVAFSSNKIIDKKGINFAVRQGIGKCLQKLKRPEGNPLKAVPDSTKASTGKQGLPSGRSLVLLDGGLKAPSNWSNQRTIIKGDEKELIISLASIVAKVSRDRRMVKLAQKYPNHNLHQHKGYGTKAHYLKIEEFGTLVIHRKTYLR